VAAPVSAAMQNNNLPSSRDAVVTPVAAGSIAKITNPKGAVLYSDPVYETKTSRFLPAGSTWKVSGQYGHGVRWYKVGSNQWIKVVDASLTAPTTSNKSNQGDQHVLDLQGTARVTYKTPIVVWAEPGAKPTKRYLPKDSAWKYFKVVETSNGEFWYNLGGNQWIPGRYVNFGQDPRIAHYTPAYHRGSVATVTSKTGARIYLGSSSDPSAKATSRVLPRGSRWKVFGSKNYGLGMYNVGGNQWVHALDVSVN
jgi:hypothetical protein